MKKILKAALIAAMGALMLGMVSCKKDEDSDQVISQKGFGRKGSWTVNKTNEAEGDAAGKYMRVWDVLQTGHTSGDVHVFINDSEQAGVLGLIFGLDNHKLLDADGNVVKLDNKEVKVYDFGIAGLRRMGKKVQYYVSWFKNVSTEEDYLKKANNFCDYKGVKIGDTGSTATETGPQTDIVYFTDDAGKNLELGVPGVELQIDIHLEATGEDKNKDGKITDTESDGGYKVVFKSTAGKVLAEKVITPAVTGNEKVKQGGFGCYANVYPKKTLVGEVNAVSLVQELAVEE